MPIKVSNSNESKTNTRVQLPGLSILQWKFYEEKPKRDLNADNDSSCVGHSALTHLDHF